ncbi:MAG: secretin N-terminal domain-containing protein [Armatimonadota bacterium]
MKLRVLIGMIVIGVILGGFSPAFSGENQNTAYIQNITVSDMSELLEVQVYASKPVEYKVITMNDPYTCLIVDIYSAELTASTMINTQINKGMIKKVRTGQFSDNPKIVRLVIDLEKHVDYNINTAKDNSTIMLSLNYEDKTNHMAVQADNIQTAESSPVTAKEISTPGTDTAAFEAVSESVEISYSGAAANPDNSNINEAIETETYTEVVEMSAPQEESTKTVSSTVTEGMESETYTEIPEIPVLEEESTKTVSSTVTESIETETYTEIPEIPVPEEESSVAYTSTFTEKNTETASVTEKSVETPDANPVTIREILDENPVETEISVSSYTDAVAVNKTTDILKEIPKTEKIPVPEEAVKKLSNKSPKQETLNHFAYTAPEGKKSKSTKSNKAANEPTLDVNYVNEDIVFILRELAKKTGKNIVTDNSVTGTITVSLKKVTLDRALQVILKTAGLGYKKIDNIIVVSSNKNLARISPVNIKKGFGTDTFDVIPINYSKAEDVQKSILAILPDLEITVDKRLNALVVSASGDELKYVKSLVEQLDQLPSISQDPNTVTKVIKVKYGKAVDIKEMVGKWYPQIRIVTDERINGFIVKETKDNIEKLEKFINEVDAPKRQVELDVKIVDLTESGSKSLGVTWNSGGSIFTTTFNEVQYNGVAWQDVNNANWPPIQTPTYVDLPFGTFARTPITLTMALNYLVTKGEAKILGSPKVVTLSGEKAIITVGQKYPITYNDPRAGTTQAEYIDIAIKLEVTPQITPDGFIMAEVKPEISEISTTQLGSAFPETTTRKLNTNAIVKEGDTIILAGLYRKSFSSTRNKIPLLGDMPYVGEFFKNTSDLSTKDELVIMITPKIVNPETE